MPDLTLLGKQVSEPIKKLEVFKNPGVQLVKMKQFEFTWRCPVTGQPDFGYVEIEYDPAEWCLESKSLKLYLWTFRQMGTFTETLAREIAKEIKRVVEPHWVCVRVFEQARGGIEITAECTLTEGDR